MKCETCGNQYAARLQYHTINDKIVHCCDKCGASSIWLPDVYLEPGSGLRTNENLCDEHGTPIPFSSKREKALIMKQLGLRQADCAEKQKGMRLDSYTRKKYFI